MHPDAVALWYRALTLHQRALLLKGDFGAEPGTPEGTAQRLQMQLLCLSISSSKAALDMLLAGYYSIAFGAIRHMLESAIQCIYVGIEPDQALLWYAQEGRIKAQSKSPEMWKMRDAIKVKARLQPKDLPPPALIDRIYDDWDLMSKGSHPTGTGIMQTVVDGQEEYLYGPTYRRDHCLQGFQVGLFAVSAVLLAVLVLLKPQSEEWHSQREQLLSDVRAWQTTH